MRSNCYKSIKATTNKISIIDGIQIRLQTFVIIGLIKHETAFCVQNKLSIHLIPTQTAITATFWQPRMKNETFHRSVKIWYSLAFTERTTPKT